MPTKSNQLADTNKELERAPEMFLDTSVNLFERQILTRRRTPAHRYNVDPVASALDRLEPSERSLRGNALSLRPFASERFRSGNVIGFKMGIGQDLPRQHPLIA